MPDSRTRTPGELADDGFVPLADCPPGVFVSPQGWLGFRNEYWTDKGEPEAYVLASGEFYWGGVDTHAERRKVLVRPLDPDEVATALRASASTAPEPSEAEVEAGAREYDPGPHWSCHHEPNGRREQAREQTRLILRAAYAAKGGRTP